MKRFQQLLSEQSQNEYGLQYKPIKPAKNLLRNIQNSYESKSVENPETVQVYLKSDCKKNIKMKLIKKSKLQKLKETIEERLLIPFEDQLIYLNGKEISVFSSITFNEKQILHIADRKNIVEENQSLFITLKVSAPHQEPFNNKIYRFNILGGQKVHALKNILFQQIQFEGFENKYEINFLESGRMLNKEESFSENLITKNCDIVCLLSQNEIETKFVNQCQEISQSRELNYERIVNPVKNHTNVTQPIKKPQSNDQFLKFKKIPFSSNKFLVDKGKPNIYTKISKTTNHNGSQFFRPQINKRKSQTDAFSSPSGFKKKKPFQDEFDSDDSHLIKKILVHKSRQEIEKIASENSLIRDEVTEVQEEKKSVVSSSSSEQKEKEKQYVPIRQQKQYRPCPLIPQRKMATSEKIKINMELQKLFGGGNHEQKMNLFSMSEPQNSQQEPSSSHSEPQVETTRSRVIIRNSNMRNSISAKQSMLRIIKDKRPNRYAEENMNQGD